MKTTSTEEAGVAINVFCLLLLLPLYLLGFTVRGMMKGLEAWLSKIDEQLTHL